MAKSLAYSVVQFSGSGSGNVALRANKKLEFDWKNMRITNHPETNELLKPNYREGWTI
jgi:hypothetical protein